MGVLLERADHFAERLVGSLAPPQEIFQRTGGWGERPDPAAQPPLQNRRFTSAASPALSRAVMDKFWSIFTMPIGVTLCFGPALFVWWLTEGRKSGGKKR